MKISRTLCLLAFLCLPFALFAQSWQTLPQNGSQQPFYTVWTTGLYDFGNHQIIVTQDDANDLGGIYANAVFGYNPATGAWTRLWITDGSGSCPADTATRPTNRHTYDQFAFDTTRNVAYAFSGSCNGSLAADFYKFSSSGTSGSGSWTRLLSTAPSPLSNGRQEGAMVYMANTDRVLLYGGFDGVSGSTKGDAWLYNPNTNSWSQLCSSCPPGNRHGHAVMYDESTGKVVIYGGERQYNSADIALSYVYDPVANTWTAVSAGNDAIATSYPCYGYDRQRNRILAYAAKDFLYSFSVASMAWTKLGIPAGGPTPGTSQEGNAASFCAYDYDRDYFVLFKSAGAAGGNPLAFGINFGTLPGPPPPDTTVPMVTINTPAANSSVSGTITIAAAASDNVGVVGVQFAIDGVNIGTEVTSTPYQVTFDTTTIANCGHTITATARDAAGNLGTNSITFKVLNCGC